MRYTKKQRVLSLVLTVLMIAPILFPENAQASAIKTKRVTFTEQLNGQTRSQNVNIPDVSEIVSARVVNSEGGNVTARISGKDTVRVDVSGGSYSRRVYDSTMYSRYVTDSRTSSSNSFPSTINVTEGAYNGDIGKNGSSRVISGSYTPPGTKTVEATSIEQTTDTGTGGFALNYSRDGYEGRLSCYASEYYGSEFGQPFQKKYYRGTVTRPAIDTRVYQQDYAGYIYQGGYNYYYKYDVDIQYIDDVTPPTITHTLNTTDWTNQDITINIRATDTQSGVKNIQLPNGNLVTSSTTTYKVSSNGRYTFYSTDNANNRTNAYHVDVENIDKTKPNAPTIEVNDGWQKENVRVALTNNGDTGSGVAKLEYKLTGATSEPWTSLGTSGDVTVSREGKTTITSRVIDRAGNISAETSKEIWLDKTAPTNGNLTLKGTATHTIQYNISGVVEDLSGLSERPIIMEREAETLEPFTRNVRVTDNLINLKPNEKVKVRYQIEDIAGNKSNFTNFVEGYTLAKQPSQGEIREYSGDSIKFVYTHPQQQNDARYRFKAVSSSGKEVLSSVYDYDSLVEINGLEKNQEYTLYATGINNSNEYNEYTKLKTSTGEDLTVTTKNNTQITATKSSGFNKHTFVANVKDVDLDEIQAELIVGDKVILLDDVLYKTNTSDQRQLHINLDNTKQGVTRSIEGTKDIFNVGVNLPNDKYKVVLRTTKSGDVQNLELGEYGIDTIGPTLSEKPTLTVLTGGRGLLLLNTSKISDLSSSLSEIQIDYGNGYTDVRSQVITDKAIDNIKLKDKLGNVSEHEVKVTDTSGSGGGGTTDPDDPAEDDENDYNTGVTEDDIPSNIKDNVVTVKVPNGGSHMQTSLNGVTWSNWEPRTDTTKVTLSTGDGLKSVYVRTGIQKYKETPVFNSETGRVEFITQDGGDIEPFNNMRISKYIMDLTAPKLSIRTMDNSLIAINGSITFLVDVVDNLDEQPKVKIEILERDGNGTLKASPIFNKTVQLSKGSSTGTITPNKLRESRNSQNKLQPYTLRVTAYDKTGNKSVEHLNFYVKNK